MNFLIPKIGKWFTAEKRFADDGNAALAAVGCGIAIATLPISLVPVVAGVGIVAAYDAVVLAGKAVATTATMVKQSQERRRILNLPKPVFPPPPPPPPTREELAAGARERFESTLRILESARMDEVERNAARTQARQQYLRELDGLMR